jgi:two-component system sensor histidine kinase HydH
MSMFRKPLLALMQGGFSPWAIVGGIGVVFAVLAGLTIDSLNRQDRVSLDLLSQKGLALMRSLEAGTRAGMMERQWGLQRLQLLMTETVQQPDVAYILITGLEGDIRAHSDADQVGQRHGTDLDLALLAKGPTAHSRVMETADGLTVLEVSKRFTPLPPERLKDRPGRGMGMGALRSRMEAHHKKMGLEGLGHMQMQSMASLFAGAAPETIIFVGLDMTPYQAARSADIRRAVGMALVMLVVGAAGVLLLFLSQAYRTTRTSLHREKAFSHHLVAHLPVGVVAVGPNEAIVSINPVARQLIGRTGLAQAAQGAGTHLPHPVREVLMDAVSNHRPAAQEVVCEVDGRRLTLEVIVAPLGKGADPEEDLGQVMLLRDLTPIKRLQRAVARNQRLAAVGRLAGGVAHEIRNPLSSIKGFATYFKERSQPTEEAGEVATILIQEVERLDRVVGQLLDFSRPAKPAMRPVTMAPFLEAAFKRVAQAAGDKGVTLDLEVAEAVDEACFDPDLIHQVLLNLYLNALDAMPAGGCLKVGASIEKVEKRLLLTISDTGRGIDADGLGQIFDPYFTTKSTGTGLGLAIVHNIVEAHAGEIQVESDPHQGTVFRISLPLAGAQEESDDEKS